MTLVLTADHGAVRVLTLNRAESRNALSSSLVNDLFTAMSEADDDPAVRAIVLTGADPAFCAGLDAPRSWARSTGRPSPAAWRWRWPAIS